MRRHTAEHGDLQRRVGVEGLDPDVVGAVGRDDEDGGAEAVRRVEVADGTHLGVKQRANDDDERKIIGVRVGDDVRDVEPVEGLNHVEYLVALRVREVRRRD